MIFNDKDSRWSTADKGQCCKRRNTDQLTPIRIDWVKMRTLRTLYAKDISLYSIRQLILIQCKDLRRGGIKNSWFLPAKDFWNNSSKFICEFSYIIVWVTVIKFGVDSGGGNGIGCFEIKVRIHSAKFVSIVISIRLGQSADLIGKRQVA